MHFMVMHLIFYTGLIVSPFIINVMSINTNNTEERSAATQEQ